MYYENFCVQRIKELMRKNGYTLYQMSRKSGVSLSTLSSMFEKNTEPRVETIEKICSACDITVSQFFDQSSTDMTDSQRSLFKSFNSLNAEHQRMVVSFSRFLEREERCGR